MTTLQTQRTLQFVPINSNGKQKNAKLQLTDGKLIINGNMKNGMHRMTIRPPLGILPALTPSAPS